ncbi:MAG: hypothetical protein J6W98_00195 [Bacteroidales bacterium]|nr:hypothetical protein [Bacteroidales bacterium]
MKKIVAILAGVLAFAAVASAQPRAFGVRLGYGAEVSYQHTLGNDFGEVDLGVVGPNGFYVSGIYDFNLGSAGILNFYAGPGVQIGAATADNVFYFNAAIVGQIGTEIELDSAPVNFSLDWRPAIYLNGGGFGWTGFALGIRYRF